MTGALTRSTAALRAAPACAALRRPAAVSTVNADPIRVAHRLDPAATPRSENVHVYRHWAPA